MRNIIVLTVILSGILCLTAPTYATQQENTSSEEETASSSIGWINRELRVSSRFNAFTLKAEELSTRLEQILSAFEERELEVDTAREMHTRLVESVRIAKDEAASYTATLLAAEGTESRTNINTVRRSTRAAIEDAHAYLKGTIEALQEVSEGL